MPALPAQRAFAQHLQADTSKSDKRKTGREDQPVMGHHIQARQAQNANDDWKVENPAKTEDGECDQENRIERASEAVLQVEHGSLYPALHRLERKELVASKWQTPAGKTREVKMYRLIPAGRKHLAAESSRRIGLSRAWISVRAILPAL